MEKIGLGCKTISGAKRKNKIFKTQKETHTHALCRELEDWEMFWCMTAKSDATFIWPCVLSKGATVTKPTSAAGSHDLDWDCSRGNELYHTHTQTHPKGNIQ